MATISAYVLLLRDALLGAFGIFFGALFPTLRSPRHNLTGKTAIVTGANSGIGYELALGLAGSGAAVYLACRNLTKAEEAAASIVKAVAADSNDSNKVECKVKVLRLDTSSLASVRTFAAFWASAGGHSIDILCHNAGITSTPPDRRVTDEGLGTIYATNFLGPFVLTNLLERYLAPSARVILTSSTGQYAGNLRNILSHPRGVPSKGATGRNISDTHLYGDTKQMQVVFAHLLQKHWDREHAAKLSDNIVDFSTQRRPIAHAFAPGYVYTPLFEKTASLPLWVDPAFWVLKACTWAAISAQQGAMTGLWLTGSEEPGVLAGGGYWDRMTRRRTVMDVASGRGLQKVWSTWERDGDVRWE